MWEGGEEEGVPVLVGEVGVRERRVKDDIVEVGPVDNMKRRLNVMLEGEERGRRGEGEGEERGRRYT